MRLSEIYGSSKDKQGPNRLNSKGFRQWPGAADASLKTGVWLVTQPLPETERAAKLSADVQGRQATKLETRAWVSAGPHTGCCLTLRGGGGQAPDRHSPGISATGPADRRDLGMQKTIDDKELLETTMKPYMLTSWKT